MGSAAAGGIALFTTKVAKRTKSLVFLRVMDKKHEGGSQKAAEAPDLITSGTLKICFEEENEPKIAGLSIEEAEENVDAKFARLLHNEYWKSMKQKKSEALVLINNCNVISKAVMYTCGDMDDCISTTNYDAAELAAALDEKVKNDLPLPGHVEFINGGPMVVLV